MVDSKFDALHQTRGAINNLLSGYEKLGKEGSAEVDPVLQMLIDVHKKHAGDLLEHQSALGYSTDGDSVEMIVPIGFDASESPSFDTLMHGEAALLELYQDALAGWAKSDDPEIYDLIERQYTEFRELLAADVPRPL